MKEPKAAPRRGMEVKALIIAAVVVVVMLVLFFTIPSPDTSPVDAPTGQAPANNAPYDVETPEGAKPVEQRESN